ncbi:gametocyte-specific factor 1 homolog [Drosophila montana]|uniref:gametocyte-specific factor 1 homolog n=1 Tax=Drosophila montana TaxID=40370 RepID=UPI00313BEE78
MSSERSDPKDSSSPSSPTSQIAVEWKPPVDTYIKCPYDAGHRILRSRLSWHLTRCARNHPGSNMIRCPFNTTHVVHSSDMDSHVKNCTNRIDFVRFQNPDMLPPKEPLASPVDLVESSENWDDEPPVETYDPRAYCEQNLVIRSLVGAPPASRRVFRELERKRFQQISQGKNN